MELLSGTRQEAVQQIREQLCCVLCARIFEDPQCLDCKHNFCRECIFLHLRKNNSYCPTCRLPTRPSEITRNQFLESILAAWKSVEAEIGHLGDPSCHEKPITVADTDRALQSASAASHLSPVASARGVSSETATALSGASTPGGSRNGAAAAPDGVALPMSMQNRGRVANNKWNVDTQGIRQQMRADEPYYFHPSPMGRSKSSSSDLPDDYGASERSAQVDAMPSNNGTGERKQRAGKARRKLAVASAACSLDDASAEELESDTSQYSEDQESESDTSSEEADESQASSTGLLHTQDINSYMERINRQREALSQWERARRDKINQEAASPMTSLLRPRSSHVLPLVQRSSLEGSDEDEAKGSTETQFPMSVIATDSPNLLSTTHMSAFDCLVSSARKSRRVDDEDDEVEDDDDDTMDADEWLQSRLAKRRLELASSSPPAAAADLPHHRKRIRVPSSQSYDVENRSRTRAEPTQLEMASDGGRVFVPDSQAAHHETEELETKPPAPLEFQDEETEPAPSPKNVQHDKKLQALEKPDRPAKRVSQDFEGAIKAFQAQQLHGQKTSSAAAAALAGSRRGETATGTAAGASASPSRIRNGILNAAMMRTVLATPPGVVKMGSTPSNRPPLPVSSTNISSAAGKKSAGEREFVLVGTDLSKDEVKSIMDACTRLGGRFGRHFDTKRNRKTGAELTSVTHLVTKAVPPPFTSADGEVMDLPGLRCKRTAKYMQALAEGAFVVDMAWVSDSVSAGKWLPEEPYEMQGDMYSDAMGKPRESRLRRAQTGRRNDIFNMFRFVMLCQDEEFEYQLQSVRAVVETFGGVFNWAHEYDALPAEQRARKTPIGVVSKSLPSWVAKTRWQQYQIPIVRVTWLFDSISHVEVLPFDDYYPY